MLVKKIIYNTFLFIVLFCILLQQHVYSQNKKVDTTELRKLETLYQNNRLSNPFTALEHAAHAFQLAVSAGDSIKMAQWLVNIGNVHYDRKVYYIAMDNYFKAYEIFQDKDTDKLLADCSMKIGNIYLRQNVFRIANDYYSKALNIYEAMNNTEGIGDVYEKNGLLMLKQDDVDSALVCFNKVLDIRNKTKNKQKIADARALIAKAYKYDEEFELAEKNLLEAFEIYQKLDNTFKLAETYYALAEIYFLQTDYNTSREYFSNAYKLFYELQLKNRIAASLIQIGKIHYKRKQYDETLNYANRALNIVNTQIAYLDLKRDIFLLIADVYSELKQPELALKNYKRYIQIRDSIITEKQQQQYSEMQQNLEVQQKQNEIKLLQLQAQQEKEKQRIRNNQNIAIIITITLVSLAFGLVFLHLYRAKSKANKILEEKNKQINEQQEELIQNLDQVKHYSEELREANATKDRMFSIIGHDLRNPIGSFKNMLELVVQAPEQFEESMLMEILKSLSESANMTYNLLENLLYWAKNQRDEISFTPEKIQLHKLVEENVALLTGAAQNKSIHIQSDLKDKSEVFADKNMITTVIRNLLSNAIKFTPNNGKVTISTNLVEEYVENHGNVEYVQVKVADNGIGISKKNMEKLFNKSEHFTTYGTNDEKGSGLGLILCKEFIEKNGGKILVKSEEGKGTEFIITLVKANNHNGIIAENSTIEQKNKLQKESKKSIRKSSDS